MTSTEPNLTQTETGSDDGSQAQALVDFKMVTFSLGGKDYGIDIMQVKEIAKFSQFTYVPNTAPFVKGVYNLRGDIISVIDLRLMFNLPAQQREEGQPENGLILRLENNLIGVIVDRIDKVVGISSSQVQPPHPIFGDINVKYISGVAEHEERLYIILDVDRIFSREDETDDSASHRVPPATAMAEHSAVPDAAEPNAETERSGTDERSMQRDFVRQGLTTFAGFSVTPVNADWFDRRMDQWREERNAKGADVQLADADDAAAFLSTFHSRHNGALWQSDYVNELFELLPEPAGAVVHAWNVGCADGYESYSIAAALQKRYSDRQRKVWAGDKDLMKISTAPNLVVSRDQVPESWLDLIVDGKNGPTFSPQLKDTVLFEFSDVLNAAGMPKMDYIVARDLLSYHPEAEQRKILEAFEETLKPGGALVLGDNERVLDDAAWEEITGDSLTVYRRR